MKDFEKDFYIKNNDDDDYEVNYTNAKGFYEYLTMNIRLISDFRLQGSYKMWFKALDCMFVSTFPYWPQKDNSVNTYEELYLSVDLIINRSDSVISSKSKMACDGKINRLLRQMNMLVTKNTAHLMIKLSQPDEDDSKAWREIFGEDS